MAARLLVGFGSGALFLLLALHSFWTALLAVVVIHTLCQFEFARLSPGLEAWKLALHVLLTTAVLCLASLSLLQLISPCWPVLALCGAVLVSAVLALLEYERTGRVSDWLTLRALLFISLPLSCVAPVAASAGAFPFLLLLIGASWGADTGAIYSGMLLGKRPLAPRISPKKTLEGLLGGALSAGAIWAAAPLLYPLPGRWLALGLGGGAMQAGTTLSGAVLSSAALFVLGALVSLAGAVGDLTFSLFKRQAGLKDYGRLLPGHGGMLDRVDSFIFAAPLVYLLCLL
jgi:phosphatidate cytidylyltransferase